MEINIGTSECHKNVDNYYGSNITVWIPHCAGREAFDGVKPLHGSLFTFCKARWAKQKENHPTKVTKIPKTKR